jgi:ribonuclease PH
MKNYLRKLRHLRYTKRYLCDIRWEIINTVVACSATGFHNGVDNHLENLGGLVIKYERRLRLLKF